MHSYALMFICLFTAPAHHTQAPIRSIKMFMHTKKTPYKNIYPTDMHKDMLVHTDIFVGISQLLGYDNLIQSLTLELF